MKENWWGKQRQRRGMTLTNGFCLPFPSLGLASLRALLSPSHRLPFVLNLSDFSPPLGLHIPSFLCSGHTSPYSLCSKTCSSVSPRLNASRSGESCPSLNIFIDPEMFPRMALIIKTFDFFFGQPPSSFKKLSLALASLFIQELSHNQYSHSEVTGV